VAQSFAGRAETLRVSAHTGMLFAVGLQEREEVRAKG